MPRPKHQTPDNEEANMRSGGAQTERIRTQNAACDIQTGNKGLTYTPLVECVHDTLNTLT